MENRSIEAKLPLSGFDQNLVIDAFTEAEHLSKWWNVEKHLIDLKPGGIYSLGWGYSEKGIQFVSTGIINSYKPGQYLLIDKMVYFNPQIEILGPMQLSFVIHDDGTTKWLKVTQSGYQEGPDWDWYYEAVRIGWPQALKSLQNYLNLLTQ